MPPSDFDYDFDDIDDLIAEDEAMQAGAFEESPENVQTSTAAADDVEEYDYEEEGEEEEDGSAEECVRRRGVRQGVGRVNYSESDEDSADGSDANSVAEEVASPVPSMGGVADDASMPSAPTSGHASDESDADGGDVLRSKLLYTDNDSDWATAEQKALQLGRDAAWINEVKRKRDEMMKALGQVEGANAHAIVLGLEWDASNQQRASAARRLSKILHLDKHLNAPEAFRKRLDLAFKRVIEARDADDFAAAVPRTRTEKQRDKETARRAAEEKKRQAQRAKVEAASQRATNFQQQAMGRIKAPERAINGITPWVPPGGKNGARADPIKVAFAKVDSCKVPAFGSLLKTVDGNEVEFLPAARTTLLIEAGCSAEKTRQLIKWILKELETNPDMPIIFVTCRKSHADDLWATLKGFGLDFVNYRDANGKAESKTAYMANAKRLIVSLQSLHLVDPSLYVDGLVVVDEIRSAFSIPGGETLPQPVLHMQGAMRMLCEQAAYRVFMDADVSADGAVEAGIRLVAPRFDVLHVQLQQAALRRIMSLSFTGPKGSTGKANFDARMKLWLLRVRTVSDDWVRRQTAVRIAATFQLHLLESYWGKQDKANGLPSAETEGDRNFQRSRLQKRKRLADVERAFALKWLIQFRKRKWAQEDGEDGEPDPEAQTERENARERLRQRERTACFGRQRVLISCATPMEARKAAKLCDALGVAYHYYSGSTDDDEKAEHFKNTTRHWSDAAVIIATTTMTVAVNVRIHFSVVFLMVRRAEQAGRLRELLQQTVRVGRDEDDPLEDEHIFTLITGEPPDFAKFKLLPQDSRFKCVLDELQGWSDVVRECDDAAKTLYDKVAGGFHGATPSFAKMLLELVAWNKLEGKENCGDVAVVKLVELCKLPTRAWAIELTPPLTDAEKAETDALTQQEPVPLDAESADKAEDRMVGMCSMKDKYSWVQKDIDRRAAKAVEEQERAATVEINALERAEMLKRENARLRDHFFMEQEAYRYSEVARPAKDAREIAKESVFKVIELLGRLPTIGELEPSQFGKLAQDDTMAKLQRRAAAATIPLDEQRKVYERLRRKGATAHPIITTQWHTQTKLLQDFAKELELPLDRLLHPAEYTREDDWVQVANRRTRNDASCMVADNDKVNVVCDLAKSLGAHVTKQMGLQKLIEKVLVGVLKLESSKPVQQKEDCGAQSKDGRALQLTSWGVHDEWAAVIPKLRLPLLHPDGTFEARVPQAEWQARFEQVQQEAEEGARQDSYMDVDEGEQLAADLTAAGPADLLQPTLDPFVETRARRFNEYSKTEKYDVPSIDAALDDLRRDEGERESLRQRVFERLASERSRMGPTGQFKAAGVALLVDNGHGDLCVLLAKENRFGYVKYNFIGGKREGREDPRATAAREAFEECAGLFTQQDGERLKVDPQAILAEYWAEASKYSLFAIKLDGEDLPARVAALGEYPVPGAPNLVSLELVPLRTLIGKKWSESNVHGFCQKQLEAIRPWLKKYVEEGDATPPAAPAQLAPAELKVCEQNVQKLEAWYHDLERCAGFHELFQSIKRRAEKAKLGADGRVHFTIEYEHKGLGGRRYAKGETLARRHGDRRERSATLQAMYSDARGILVGLTAYDIDCENGDFRLIKSIAEQLGLLHTIPYVLDYISRRDVWLQKIVELHKVEIGVAKRLPNIVSNGGGYRTWLEQNNLAFTPLSQWYQPILKLQEELLTLRKVLFLHPRFKAMVDIERERHQREKIKSEFSIDASLMSRITQTCENEVLSIIDRVFFDLGWDTLALVFDGLVVEPAEGSTSHRQLDGDNGAMAKAEAACKSRGWDIKLAIKKLHRYTEYTAPDTLIAARAVAQAFAAWEAQLA